MQSISTNLVKRALEDLWEARKPSFSHFKDASVINSAVSWFVGFLFAVLCELVLHILCLTSKLKSPQNKNKFIIEKKISVEIQIYFPRIT